MEDSLKREFTRRISQANGGELIVIKYEIVFAYMEDARQAYEQQQYETYKTAIKQAQKSIDSLKSSLDAKFEISKELYSLYNYAISCLAKAIYQNKTDGIMEAEKVLKPLYTSFCEAAKTDHSGPLMRNTQQVYAGMTYGRNSLNENCYDNGHRGFFV